MTGRTKYVADFSIIFRDMKRNSRPISGASKIIKAYKYIFIIFPLTLVKKAYFDAPINIFSDHNFLKI